MFETILISIAILAISLLLLGIKMLFVKGGKFPNTHVSGNPKMRECGVGCAQSQDRASRKRSRYDEFVELKNK
ncbi:hypothetical protein Bcop_1309 [Bacteroides coprosuis DSM 18011]|uniref:Uncharacterized protein n=1 Tax=Bacteroides coprosuis DSM 18011 TaxID=679937 RepID=F3ZNT2_9BACE|nr:MULTISPECIES: hypothetical protein [Bacteroides]EGJ71508.1 hypothetical protein Bcop_1309 [Bacteroides coprosuis DSM 18011]HJD92522.1 hypothetical protein [Bacteroides coprosuis]